MNTYSPTITTEPDDDYDNDYDAAIVYQEILDDLASGSENFSRSNEQGWYYSDED